MSDPHDATVHRSESEPILGVHTDATASAGPLRVDLGEDGDLYDSYIDFARSAGTSCRHLNRTRRHRYEAGGPDDFDD